MTARLIFRSTVFNPVFHDGRIWLTSVQLASALEYADSRAVTGIYNSNEDEFTPCMSQVVESTTSGNYRKKVRIFSLRGAHLVAMFARTPVAKEFRKWVLDILDKEVETKTRPTYPEPYHTAHEKFTPRDTSNLTSLIRQMSSPFRFKYAWSNAIWYALREVTGIPSPHAMEVRHIPIMVKECERILRITERLDEAIVTAEKTAMRRLIRKRENVNKVLADITDQLNEASQSHINKLPPHLLLDLNEFRQRS